MSDASLIALVDALEAEVTWLREAAVGGDPAPVERLRDLVAIGTRLSNLVTLFHKTLGEHLDLWSGPAPSQCRKSGAATRLLSVVRGGKA